MKIHIENNGEVTVVFVEGNIPQENVSIFRNGLLDLIKAGRIKIVIDMISLNQVSSMGLATIADIKKRVTDLGGDLKLARHNKLVQDLLEITNLIRIFEVFDDVDAAVKSFAV